jgi:hypothetical protein
MSRAGHDENAYPRTRHTGRHQHGVVAHRWGKGDRNLWKRERT